LISMVDGQIDDARATFDMRKINGTFPTYWDQST